MAAGIMSGNGRAVLNLQDDGNLVLYHDNAPVWASNTFLGPAPVTPTEPRLVRANFCNLLDATGRAIFSSCLAGEDPTVQADWIRRERDAGGTHYVLSIQVGYPPFYPDETNFYLAGRMPEWLAALDRVLDAGLVPVVFLSSGNRYPGSDYFRGVLAAIPTSYHARCVWVCGWECVRGGWSSAEFLRGNQAIRAALGPEPLMGCHLSQGRLSFGSNPKEADDPWNNEPDCWRSGWGPDGHPFQVFLYQSIVADAPFSTTTGWGERAKEVADRALGLPGAPDWFAGIARPTLCWFEATAFTFIRQTSTSEWAREVARNAASLGYQCFGNGLP